MEQRTVETRYDGRFARVSSGRALEIGTALAALGVADVIAVYTFGVTADFLLVLPLLCKGCCRLVAANLGDGEDGLPARHHAIVLGRGGIAEAGGNEGTLGPAVVDVREVPVDGGWRSVIVQLVAHINELLDRGDVNIVNSAEVKDDGIEGWTVAVIGLGLAATWPWIVPWSVTQAWVVIGVGATGVGVNVVSQLVQVVVGIRIIEAFRKSIDENSWIWVLNINIRVRTITVVKRKEDVSGKRIIQAGPVSGSAGLGNSLVIATDELIVQ